LRSAVVKMNRLKHEVLITQSAWDGLLFGRTIYSFGNGRQKTNVKAKNFIAGQPEGRDYATVLNHLASLEKSPLSV
jgi:5'-nucleotidase